MSAACLQPAAVSGLQAAMHTCVSNTQGLGCARGSARGRGALSPAPLPMTICARQKLRCETFAGREDAAESWAAAQQGHRRTELRWKGRWGLAVVPQPPRRSRCRCMCASCCCQCPVIGCAIQGIATRQEGRQRVSLNWVSSRLALGWVEQRPRVPSLCSLSLHPWPLPQHK